MIVFGSRCRSTAIACVPVSVRSSRPADASLSRSSGSCGTGRDREPGRSGPCLAVPASACRAGDGQRAPTTPCRTACRSGRVPAPADGSGSRVGGRSPAVVRCLDAALLRAGARHTGPCLEVPARGTGVRSTPSWHGASECRRSAGSTRLSATRVRARGRAVGRWLYPALPSSPGYENGPAGLCLAGPWCSWRIGLDSNQRPRISWDWLMRTRRTRHHALPPELPNHGGHSSRPGKA